MQLYLGSNLIYTSTAGAQADGRWVSSCWRSILCKGFVWALRVDATATGKHQTIQVPCQSPGTTSTIMETQVGLSPVVPPALPCTLPTTALIPHNPHGATPKTNQPKCPRTFPSGGSLGHPLTPLPVGEQRETMDLVELITMPE